MSSNTVVFDDDDRHNANALDLLNDIVKYLKCECGDGDEGKFSCLACDTACQFVFAVNKEGLIKQK